MCSAETSCPEQEEAEPRQWLLPLLRQHVRGAELQLWAVRLLPLARALGDKAAACAAADQLLALQCQALEAQLWDTLPAFADAATDLADAFRCLSLYLSMTRWLRCCISQSVHSACSVVTVKLDAEQQWLGADDEPRVVEIWRAPCAAAEDSLVVTTTEAPSSSMPLQH